MSIVWLDSGIIGLITNPYKEGESKACENWLLNLARKGIYVVSSSLCDYEVRRNLILESERTGDRLGLNNLDEITMFVSFLPVTDESFKMAATLWAESRLSGRPTANDSSLDADVIICAQWRILAAQRPGQMSIIATTNVKHLGRFATAGRWQDINI
ncbi:hypothetical protein NIES4071_37390 [Calothrix sp. NIES-4071]|nr:hypothetical protein NIES4071_37390 [Calothrix sp. NIES-4071]BAZ58056.1 hypothetical protein NIES4105_37320 [Calothrix sp. NIES-4105]